MSDLIDLRETLYPLSPEIALLNKAKNWAETVGDDETIAICRPDGMVTATAKEVRRWAGIPKPIPPPKNRRATIVVCDEWDVPEMSDNAGRNP